MNFTAKRAKKSSPKFRNQSLLTTTCSNQKPTMLRKTVTTTSKRMVSSISNQFNHTIQSRQHGLGMKLGGVTIGAYAATTTRTTTNSSRNSPQTNSKRTFTQQQQQQRDPNEPPAANYFCFNPLGDFPLNQKLLITENIPIESSNGTKFRQVDSVFGTDGAITLSFDAQPWDSTTQIATTWQQQQITGDGTSSPDRPLRLAISATGLSKNLVGSTVIHGTPMAHWNRNELQNFAVHGEDVDFLVGEDALIVGHCGKDDDSRFEYVPVNKQNPTLISKLHTILKSQDHIDRQRYAEKGIPYPDFYSLKGVSLFNNLYDPLGSRACLQPLLINDSNTQRAEFRTKFISENPEYSDAGISDEELKKIRDSLKDPTYDKLFLNTILPLPVVTPAHSHIQANQDGTYEIDYSTLTTRELFGNMSKEIPLMSSAVIGVADGVGGMGSYGDKNQTKIMSHVLMRLIRHNLTSDPKTTARELLGQSYTSLLRQNQINLGACTASIGVLRSAPPEEPVDEFDDGRRLSISFANLGDSPIIAFRPKHISDHGYITYVPLAMTWPLRHDSGTTPLRPPLQLTIFNYEHRPELNEVELTTKPTKLETTNFSQNINDLKTTTKEYNDVLSGKMKMSDLMTHLNLSQEEEISVNFFSENAGDMPWVAQGVEGVTLRRGDVVVAMSDGIADNLNRHQIGTPAELWEAVLSYLHPVIRAQHPATRNVRPCRQVRSKRTDHLAGALLTKYNKVPTSQMLESTAEFLTKIKDTKIPEYDQNPNNPYATARALPANEAELILQLNGETATITTQPIPFTPTPEEKELLYKSNYILSEGIKYHSTLTGDAESVVAGTLSSAMAGSLVRFSQQGHKLDDMSTVVAVVY